MQSKFSKSTRKIMALVLSCFMMLTMSTLGGNLINVSAEESGDIAAIKSAWGELKNFTVAYKTAGANEADNSKKMNVKMPNVANEAEDVARFGNTCATYNVKAKDGRTVAEEGNDYTVFATSNTENIEASEFNLKDYNDAYVYLRINSVTTEGKLGFKYGIGWGEMRSDNTIDITKDMEGSWIKVTADQVCCTAGQGIGDWRSWFSSTGSTLRYWGFQGLDGVEANITFGSVVAVNPVSLPTDTDGWSYVDWLNAAAELDFNKYADSEALAQIVNDNFDLLNEVNKIAKVKAAWAELEQYTTAYGIAGANEADNTKNLTVRLPVEGADEGDMPYIGNSYATYDVKASACRTTAVEANDYTVFASGNADNLDASEFNLKDYNDAYIYLKVNSVTTEGKLG
ncbi:MAG: hypothetical protein ACI4F7_02210, partial [Acutalibacteraceae bacterium]